MSWMFIILAILMIYGRTRSYILRNLDAVIPGILGIYLASWIIRFADIAPQHRWLFFPTALFLFVVMASFGRDLFKDFRDHSK